MSGLPITSLSLLMALSNTRNGSAMIRTTVRVLIRESPLPDATYGSSRARVRVGTGFRVSRVPRKPYGVMAHLRTHDEVARVARQLASLLMSILPKRVAIRATPGSCLLHSTGVQGEEVLLRLHQYWHSQHGAPSRLRLRHEGPRGRGEICICRVFDSVHTEGHLHHRRSCGWARAEVPPVLRLAESQPLQGAVTHINGEVVQA